MDLLVCAYPLYLTHQYFSNQNDVANLPFIAVWWSSFGVISLAENYANIDNLPFYWLLKSGVMVSLYSADYRKWLTENALTTATSVGTIMKNGVVKIANEHFPKMKEYVEKNEVTKDKPVVSWFTNWFSRTSE